MVFHRRCDSMEGGGSSTPGRGCEPTGEAWMKLTERLPVEIFHLRPSKGWLVCPSRVPLGQQNNNPNNSARRAKAAGNAALQRLRLPRCGARGRPAFGVRRIPPLFRDRLPADIWTFSRQEMISATRNFPHRAKPFKVRDKACGNGRARGAADFFRARPGRRHRRPICRPFPPWSQLPQSGPLRRRRRRVCRP